MSSTERKRFLQTRISTAVARKAYRAQRKAEREAFWRSEEGQSLQARVAKAHAEFMEGLKGTVTRWASDKEEEQC